MSKIGVLVGRRIKNLRQKRGWTQEKLSFEAQLHRAYIGQIERGEKNIGLVNLQKIAKALGIKIRLMTFLCESRPKAGSVPSMGYRFV